MVSAVQGLTRNELRIINSALDLTYKTARSAMTPMDKVFMISHVRRFPLCLLTPSAGPHANASQCLRELGCTPSHCTM